MGQCCQKPASGFDSPADDKDIKLGDVRNGRNTNKYEEDPTKRTLSTLESTSSGHGKDDQGDAGARILTALYGYEGRSQDELSFKKDDQLELLDDTDNDWWLAKHPNGSQGYVPRNYVAISNTVESQDWFFGKVTRKEAERELLASGVETGTFLVRESETCPGAYALSVRDHDANKGSYVRHYKIKNMDNGGCFIAARKTFDTLFRLVEHYSEGTDGLCQRLKTPCPKPKAVDWDLSKETKNDWELERADLVFEKKLGAGQFGEVWKGKWKNVKDIAIKTLKNGTMSVESFLAEAQIMKSCHHKHLVCLFGICSKEEPIYIITELMTNGSLLEFLREGAGHTASVAVLIDMAGQVASGMAFLEEMRFIHRDLAARNVLVGENNVVKVADFGLAKVIAEGDDEYTPSSPGAKFPIKWTAPEAASFGRFTIKSDIWSYGILLNELMTRGQIPYPGMGNREVLEQVERGYRMARARECPEPVYETMLKCWDREPNSRPTFDFLYHFFDDYLVSAEGSYQDTSN